MKKTENPYASLHRIFHEPKRLAIMSALAGAEDGVSFNELKETCDLTDGNLNRHLKVLADEKVIRTRRIMVDDRPCSMVNLTANGRKRFISYLESLEEVLKQAADNLAVEEKTRRRPAASVTRRFAT